MPMRIDAHHPHIVQKNLFIFSVTRCLEVMLVSQSVTLRTKLTDVALVSEDIN